MRFKNVISISGAFRRNDIVSRVIAIQRNYLEKFSLLFIEAIVSPLINRLTFFCKQFTFYSKRLRYSQTYRLTITNFNNC